MKKMFLLLSIVIVFICAGCSSVAEVEPTQPNITVTIPTTEPETIPTTKGAIKMTDKEKKEIVDAIKIRIDIEFPLSMEILELKTKISDTEYSTIDAVFKIGQQDMESIYEAMDKQNEEELYQWDKWLKDDGPYFPERWIYLIENREDYSFFDKTTPGRGKGTNSTWLLILPNETDDSYTIYFSYGGV